jgi:hypothetical protein
MDADGSSRKGIPKGIRFDVFKRDSFKCQFCGATAPDVLLEVDHLHPVARGGSNDITNLITACQPCNSGKSDKTLDENTTLAKARNQLEQLQERRDQLEMMMGWMEGLRELKEDALDRISSYWHALTPGFTINQNGRNDLQKWVRQFNVEEICHAMDVAAEQYLRFQDDGRVTSESWGEAFSKIPGICRVVRSSDDEPDLKDLFYIRGIVRKRLSGKHYIDHQALEFLKAAHSWGVSLEDLRSVSKHVSSWTQFRDEIIRMIREQKDLQGIEPDV